MKDKRFRNVLTRESWKELPEIALRNGVWWVGKTGNVSNIENWVDINGSHRLPTKDDAIILDSDRYAEPAPIITVDISLDCGVIVEAFDLADEVIDNGKS